MIRALTLAAESGIDVRILTPHIPDKKYVHPVTQYSYDELLAAGVRVYEYTPGFIHSKTFVSDDCIATVGTTNLDFRSLYLHFECGAVMYDCPAIADVKADFLKTLEVCEEISCPPHRNNLFSRMWRAVLRLYAPLM
jgi:cardiolipin synthase